MSSHAIRQLVERAPYNETEEQKAARLHTVFERLQEWDDWNPISLANHLETAALGVKQAATLPESSRGPLLTEGVTEILRRLPLTGDSPRASNSIELNAAKTAISNVVPNTPQHVCAAERLLTILENPQENPPLSPEQYLEAGRILLSKAPEKWIGLQDAIEVTLELVDNPNFSARGRADAVVETMLGLGTLPEAASEKFSLVFRQAISDMAKEDPATARFCLEDKTHQFELSARPDLIATLIFPSQARLEREAVDVEQNAKSTGVLGFISRRTSAFFGVLRN